MRLHNSAASVAAANRMGQIFNAFQLARGFNIRHNGLATIGHGKAPVWSGLLFHYAVLINDLNKLKMMLMSKIPVVVIMGRRDFKTSGAKLPVNIGIGNNGNFPACHRHYGCFAHKMAVAAVFRMHTDGSVARNGLRSCGGYRQIAGSIGEGIAHAPKLAILVRMFNLIVRKGRMAARTPVNDIVAPVNKALVIKPGKNLAHGAGKAIVHGKTQPCPVHRAAKSFNLLKYFMPIGFAPLPDAFNKGLASKVIASQAFPGNAPFHHILGGNAGMVRTWNPQHIFAQLSRMSAQGVYERQIQGMANMQRASDIWRRNNNGIWIPFCFGVRSKNFVFPPVIAPAFFNSGRLVCLGQILLHLAFSLKDGNSSRMRKTVYILWDSSHIWGLMALRVMRAFGLSCRLVKGIEIAQHGLLGKSGRNALLLIPGGNARQKAAALGNDGRNAIREWLKDGGLYLGFCGGAGLALCQKNPDDGLNICPWKRASYGQRLYHLLSGHVRAKTDENKTVSLPVWWPGRFETKNNVDLRVLASYMEPDEDFWLADLPLARIPRHVARFWIKCRGIDASAVFPVDEPLAIQGRFGKGNYILSYAHLETPGSRQANLWLASLLEKYWQMEISSGAASLWRTDLAAGMAPAKLNIKMDFSELMTVAHNQAARLMDLGCALHVFFKRQSWLWGWQSGFPGMACNNIIAALTALCSIRDEQSAPHLRAAGKEHFLNIFNKFMDDAESYLWTCRLDNTLDSIKPDHQAPGLRQWGFEIFGHPMLGGGLASGIISILDEYIYQLQDNIFPENP